VHDPRPPASEFWKIVDRFHYFSVFSRGVETFYAVRRLDSSRTVDPKSESGEK
jgi:hypothetical protein